MTGLTPLCAAIEFPHGWRFWAMVWFWAFAIAFGASIYRSGRKGWAWRLVGICIATIATAFYAVFTKRWFGGTARPLPDEKISRPLRDLD